MLEIIASLHPITVHFTIGLLSSAVVLYVIGRISPPARQLLVVARWNLWLGSASALLTLGSGWAAYYTVSHDAMSHTAMEVHRNWGHIVVVFFTAAAIWVWIQERRASQIPFLGLLLLACAQTVLVITGWLGGELVYHFGLGVKALPQIEEEGHGHSHGSTPEASGKPLGPSQQGTSQEHSAPPPEHHHSAGTHEHSH